MRRESKSSTILGVKDKGMVIYYGTWEDTQWVLGRGTEGRLDVCIISLLVVVCTMFLNLPSQEH